MSYGIWKEKPWMELPRVRTPRGCRATAYLLCFLVSMIFWASFFGLVWESNEVVPPAAEPAPAPMAEQLPAESFPVVVEADDAGRLPPGYEPQSMDDLLMMAGR